MRKAAILYKESEAGILVQNDDGSFIFRYHDRWMEDGTKPSISLTFPKIQQEYQSEHLFPFFYNMLPEGANRQIICAANRIDKDDYFGLLVTTARYDTVGAITVKKIETES